VVLLARLGNGGDSHRIGSPHHWSIFPARAARAGNVGHLLQSCEHWLRSGAAQAQGIAVEYREDADVRAVLEVECVIGEPASPAITLAGVIDVFRPRARARSRPRCLACDPGSSLAVYCPRDCPNPNGAKRRRRSLMLMGVGIDGPPSACGSPPPPLVVTVKDCDGCQIDAEQRRIVAVAWEII
jgi:hypothetical protein